MIALAPITALIIKTCFILKRFLFNTGPAMNIFMFVLFSGEKKRHIPGLVK